MTTTFGSSHLQDDARALRARGAWSELSALLDDHIGEVRNQPDLANLRGETYLRAGSPRESRAWFADSLAVIERRGADSASLRLATETVVAGVVDEDHEALGEHAQTLPCAGMCMCCSPGRY